MREMFEQFVIRFCFAGLGATALIAFVLATYPTVNEQIGKPLGRAVRSRRISVLLPVFCVCGTILFAIDKGPVSMNAPAPRAQVRMIAPSSSISVAEEAAMAEADEGMSLIGNWFRSGAHDIDCPVSFGDGWVFPYGTNHLSRIEIMACGKIYVGWDNPVPIAAISEDLSCRPQVTRVYCGFTPEGTYRVEWREAYANNDLNQSMNAVIDLHRDGTVIITENGVTRTIGRELPFPHSGYGQDADWVKANFTNAAEIISVGYANWVDAQVGIGLTNGLYKFTASFEENPLEATEFHIGDYSICVTNAGGYVFLLEKGTGYEFGTWPFTDDVDYFIQDDMTDNAPVLASSWGCWESPGEWSVDGGWNWLYYPSRDNPGYCNWMPTLQGSPNVSHLEPKNLPATFTAILTDYCGSATPVFRWSASDENIEFGSPNARTTTVSCASLLSWGALSMSVRADLGGYSLWSYLYPTYGTNETPQVTLDLSAPEVVFLNDDGRTTRWYRVSAKLSCPVETNATVSLVHSGATDVKIAADPIGESCLSLTNVQLAVSSSAHDAEYAVYFACMNFGTGSFTARCTMPDGEVKSATRDYRVIEPLRKLVCTDFVSGGYYNPSRLVYGTNAWLKVGVRGSFSASEVGWRVVSGPGRITATNGWTASVEPTEPSGEVVVEAAFGTDAQVQPRFVLPIVTKRRISVKACVVADDTGAVGLTEQLIDRKIDDVNDIFSQVGIEFYRPAPIQVITNSQFLIIEENLFRTNKYGHIYLSHYPTAQVTNLIAQVNTDSGESIKLIWVNDIVQGTPIAFSMRLKRSCIFASNYLRASRSVPAHEIGHIMGLQDIYNARKHRHEQFPEGDLPVSGNIFSEYRTDWIGDDERGFYEISDTHKNIIERLLMHGRDRGGVDIPSGSVKGYSSRSQHVFDVQDVPVGATSIGNVENAL